MKMLNKVRRYTLGEEVANSITHGVMAFVSFALIAPTAIHAYLVGGVLDAVGTTIFASSIFLMFMTSTLYHIMSYDTKHKTIFQILDHIFIYIAIAGTYTPIALSVVGGWQGIVIASLQWSMVLFGILYKSLARNSIPKISLTIYLVMGWTILIFLPIFIIQANIILVILIGSGGVMYSAGVLFYSKKHLKYHHMLWHFFVNVGVAAHYVGLVFFLK